MNELINRCIQLNSELCDIYPQLVSAMEAAFPANSKVTYKGQEAVIVKVVMGKANGVPSMFIKVKGEKGRPKCVPYYDVHLVGAAG